MCYLVVERYSSCRCLYYKHSVDKCAAHGKQSHGVQERTVLVGYACERHSSNDKQTSLWSDLAVPDTAIKESRSGLSSVSEAPKGVKITSVAALSALREAHLLEDDGTSTEAPDESAKSASSTQTTVEHDNRYEAKAEVVTNQTANLDDLRARLLHPKQYITSLQELERTIWNNSIISIYTRPKSDKPKSDVKGYGVEDYIPYPDIPLNLQDILPKRLSDDPFALDPTNTSDQEITAICEAAQDHIISSHLNAIRWCRNAIVKTFLNLKLLQQANFCAGSFSAIVVDQGRLNVAMLQTIESTDFIALVFELEYILRDSASLVLNASGRGARPDLDRQFSFLKTPMVQKCCKTLLQLNSESSLAGYLGTVNILRLLVITLDLAVASYAGAHCSDLPSDIFPAIDGLYLLAPFDDCADVDTAIISRFHRCRLECLNAFHHGKAVWAFSPPLYIPYLPLYVSATIEGFSDIWGPLWKMKSKTNPGNYSSYVVGGGSIVQWKQDPETSPRLRPGESFCHWISNEELESGTQDKLFAYPPFDGTERLLIGAPSGTADAVFKDPWSPNLMCSASISKARTQLREAGRLCIVGACKPYHYNDSNQYQLQVGYSGVNASATRQYKRVPGQSLKAILVELWAMEPDMRDPALLEDLHGVEVSICTSNAQRASLAKILGLKCMQHLLRDFNWHDSGYREEHFLTLEDTLRPKRLLDPLFKERFDYAVMLGLKMLSKTGVDRDDNLQVFLSSTCTPKPELATMDSKEHTWVGLLRDTTTECSNVAFGDTCLDFEYVNGVCCGGGGQSALKSAIVLHSSMLASLQQLNLQERTPNGSSSTMQSKETTALEVGKSLSLGERGSLRLKANMSGGLMVTGWSPQSMKMTWKSKLGRELVHREYTEVDHSEEGKKVKALPVIVVSDKPWRSV